MKIILINLLLVFNINLCFSQSDLEYRRKFHTKAELNVGDKMPDLSLGTVIENRTGKTKFSQFKGTPIILDFWTTRCTSCLAFFPHVEELQRRFGKSVQFFIVNPIETQTEIREILSKINGGKYKLPNLPSIVNAKKLGELFPTPFGMPHEVLIDGSGVIRARGAYLNISERKIRDLLNGRPIYSLNDGNNTEIFDSNTPYYRILSHNKGFDIKMGSQITAYNNKYTGYSGGYVTDKIDSTNGTVRNTFINRDVLFLYETACKDLFKENAVKTIFAAKGPKDLLEPNTYFIKLFVNDTTKYTELFIRRTGKETDEDFIKSNYCYEQITPKIFSESIRHEMMLKDLNNYFGPLYNVTVTSKKIKVNCFVLKLIGEANKLSTKSEQFSGVEFVDNGVAKIRYTNVALKDAISSSLFGKFTKNLSVTNDSTLFIFDETNLKANVDITLPSYNEIGNIEDLQNAIKPYGLEIIKEQREIKMLVFEEKDYKKEK